MRIAIIGGGVAGLVCAHLLRTRHEITLFEADARLGGHAHTVRVELAEQSVDVDTGFIVYNERNYPAFTALLAQLGVATQPSEMSFSVSCAQPDLEYRGNGLHLFAQPRNALTPAHQRMLADILRFNRAARRLLASDADPSAAEFVGAGRYGTRLVSHYLVPLGSAIWSADPARFLDMPARTLAHFLDNHGMLALKGRPQWRTVRGGSVRYVEALVRPFAARTRTGAAVEKVSRDADGVQVVAQGSGVERFDAVIVATHSDQALALLADPTPAERAVLGAITYRPNVTTLHTDPTVMPRRRLAWASWNYHVPDEPRGAPTVTYWMNRLQRLGTETTLCVTLNRAAEIAPERVLGQWTYAHPVYDVAAVRAQRRRHEIQGRNATWYCGAYWGNGFHEDAVQSALSLCAALDPACRLPGVAAHG